MCFFDLAVDKARLRYRSLLSTANLKVALQVESAISEETVKVHIKHIMEKLHASDRTDAVAIGVRRGIIHL